MINLKIIHNIKQKKKKKRKEKKLKKKKKGVINFEVICKTYFIFHRRSRVVSRKERDENRRNSGGTKIVAN